MSQTILHEPQNNRFTTSVQGHLCVIDYVLRESVMTITHTGVPPAVGGQGIAAALTQAALETARQNQWRVVPQCSYVATYIKRHPQYADLTA
jgi:predicted GNAT family acetyltransferase